MRLTLIAAVFLSASAAFAQPAPDWRAVLNDLYRIDVAFDACKDVTPTASEFLRLEAAISYVEEASGLEEDALDELYGEIEREAAALDEFCKRMGDAVDRLRAVPESYR